MPESKCLVFCAATNCYSTQHSATLHKFPKDEATAREWAKRCGREDFNDIIDLYGSVPGNYRLCSAHFSPNKFNKSPMARNRTLHALALPTIFNQSSNEQSGSKWKYLITNL